ncbi:hypothetical protein Tco_1070625 [Tanacetum coccineum]|uniref:Uncharacterized protein n=1 Tax=Tanacetum coccineum TaxID=301880 RepID=A0ABQ5HLY6_9ASTR
MVLFLLVRHCGCNWSHYTRHDIVGCTMVSSINETLWVAQWSHSTRQTLWVAQWSHSTRQTLWVAQWSHSTYQTLWVAQWSHSTRITECNIPSPITLAPSRAPPVVEFYSGDIVSRRVLTLCIPSPIVIVIIAMVAVVGPWSVPN